jgi:2-polyprenyl-3-methyl-5-hydroxy-6-metoxy-1,4-benzoquinol methylase
MKRFQKRKRSGFDAIKDAHQLSGDPEQIQMYYDKWAGDYDRDVLSEEYIAPNYIAYYLHTITGDQDREIVNTRDRNIKILDAGCGTGLVGLSLKEKGYKNIDGCDLSERMVQRAKERGAYNNLESGIDLTRENEAYDQNQYDATVCCGVFTLGHVPPTALLELIRVTRPGGVILVSTRKSYSDSADFEEVCQRYEREGKVKLMSEVRDGPYIRGEGAHYWAFQVL